MRRRPKPARLEYAALPRLCSAVLFRCKSLTTNYLHVSTTIRYKEITITQPLFIWLHRKIGIPLFTKRCDQSGGWNPAQCPKTRSPEFLAGFQEFHANVPQPQESYRPQDGPRLGQGYLPPANFVSDGKLELLNTAGTAVRIQLSEIKGRIFVRESATPGIATKPLPAVPGPRVVGSPALSRWVKCWKV